MPMTAQRTAAFPSSAILGVPRPLKGIMDEELDKEVAVIRGSIWDNCRDYCNDCDLHIPENKDRREIPVCPRCGMVMGFIPYLGIMDYLKILDPEEREAREKGIWKHLSGLVYKEFGESHQYEDFQIPRHWTKYEAIDPHDGRSTHWLFAAVSPEEIEVYGKRVHRIYVYGQLNVEGSIESIVNTVKSFRALHGYTDPYNVILDRKHGEKTQMEDRSWFSELSKAGIRRIKLSQSSTGDVELGHKIVRAYLVSQFSAVKDKAVSGLMFAKTGCGGVKGVISSMRNYQYRTDSTKPEEKYKDWPDTVRYICMDFPKYRDPQEEQNNVLFLKERYNKHIQSKRIAR
jgi:hypothetical protein